MIGKRIPSEELAFALNELHMNVHLREFLGKWLESGFSNHVLGQSILLDNLSALPQEEDLTGRRITELEQTLKDGVDHCQDFAGIFRDNPSFDRDIDNNRLLDVLVEVETYRWLRKSGFGNIRKLRETRRRTVDFTAEKTGQFMAIEATRFRNPVSAEKVVPTTFEREVFLGDANEPIHMEGYHEKTASPKIQQSIRDAVNSKLPQLRAFHKDHPEFGLILVVSTGNGFIYSRKYSHHVAGMLPQTPRRAAEVVWEGLGDGVRALVEGFVLLRGQRESVHPDSLASFIGTNE